jgi:hypothetical protein
MKRFFLFAALLITFVALPARAEVEPVKIIRKLSGQFLTNVAGTSVTQPPYIQVMRSKAGLEYTLGQFESHKNRITQQRINTLRSQLAHVDYDREMVIGLFSQPMDNFDMELKQLTEQFRYEQEGGRRKKAGRIVADVTYLHNLTTYAIPPKKTIHYLLLVVPTSDLPVTLEASEIVTKKGRSGQKVLTVTGRLMPLTGDGLMLVPVVIKRGDKNSYYIRGEQALRLEGHIGKVVTLQGTVSPERNSPYEFELDVEKVLKVY